MNNVVLTENERKIILEMFKKNYIDWMKLKETNIEIKELYYKLGGEYEK